MSAGARLLGGSLRPAPQVEPCRGEQSADDDSKRLPPAEARRPTQTQGIGECRNEDEEYANAGHDPREHTGLLMVASFVSTQSPNPLAAGVTGG